MCEMVRNPGRLSASERKAVARNRRKFLVKRLDDVCPQWRRYYKPAAVKRVRRKPARRSAK